MPVAHSRPSIVPLGRWMAGSSPATCKKGGPEGPPFFRRKAARRWLHSRALDALPAGLDRLHGGLRQRHIVQAQRKLVALLKAPLEEFQRVLGRLLVRRILVDQDVGGGSDRPGLRAGLIDQDHIEAVLGGVVPIGIGGGG